MRNVNTEEQKRAYSFLKGEIRLSLDEALPLSRKLQAQAAFGLARKLLQSFAINSDLEVAQKRALVHQLSLCTYKDSELAPAERFDSALRILGQLDELGSTNDQETLGQAGAIFKYKWTHFGQKSDLESALVFYLRGANPSYPGEATDIQYAERIGADLGYTAINAAFILDLLAHVEECQQARNTGLSSRSPRRQEAVVLRQRIISTFKEMRARGNQEDFDSSWWALVTWAEAELGVRNPDNARPLLLRARALGDIDYWKWETTVRQLVLVVDLQLQIPDDSGSLRASYDDVLRDFLKGYGGAYDSARLGKIGLALSGGGFRASLFHIGVLARLAECDVLRHVEVLSCVSGGSIVGAYYYLEIKKLLQEKCDDDLTRADYLDIVARLQDSFLAGVQRNLRMRAFTNLLHNLRAGLTPHYTVTEYMGELYERELFARVPDAASNQTGGAARPKERYLNGLYVTPCGAGKEFHPRNNNWRRRNKVPMLVLNATALNTGHEWQFTASWMGEPPAGINSDIDANYRLRRMYYDSDEIPTKYRNYRLGRAVAASSCVPGLFDPIELDHLYEDVTVQLVDGGVHDNQGVNSLIEENCTVILVSDASGQMGAEDHPSSGTLDVTKRTNDILMSRVREAQYDDLKAREQSALLRGVMFLHLKKDLDVVAKNWIGCDEPADNDATRASNELTHTYYGVDKKVQAQIAAIRTDLDSFNDIEAYALMYSGYAMSTADLKSLGLFESPLPARPWRFFDLAGAMLPAHDCRPAYDLVRSILAASRYIPGKIWRLAPLWSSFITCLIAASVLGVLDLMGLHVLAFRDGLIGLWHWLTSDAHAFWLGLGIVALLVLALKFATIRRFMMAGIMIPGSLIGLIHRVIYDWYFLQLGSLVELKSTCRAPLEKVASSLMTDGIPQS